MRNSETSSSELLLDSDLFTDRHLHLKIMILQRSTTIHNVRKKSSLPIVHVVVIPFAIDAGMDDFYLEDLRTGNFLDAVEVRMEAIASHFLPTLDFADVEWCYEVYRNHKDSLFRSPHIYALVGHKKLFEHTDFLRKGDGLLLQQEVLLTSVHMHWKKRLFKRNSQ